MVLGGEQGVIDKTNNTDSELIRRALDDARGIVEEELEAVGLTAPTSSTTLSLAVNLIASSLVGLKPGATDPRTGYKVDGFERSDGNKKSQVEEWEDAGMKRIATYIAANTARVPVGRSTTS